MVEKKQINKNDRLYTAHGKKKPQGIPSVINGQKALATFEGEEIVGYTTLDELTKVFYTRENLPEYNLSF